MTHWTSEIVAPRADWSAGNATFTTVPSIKAMLEPRMATAITQPLFAGDGSTHGFARITASSQGGLAMLAIIHSHRDEGGSPTELADKHAFDFRRTPDIHPEVLHQFSTYCKFGLGFPVVWLFAVCTATQPLLEES